MRSRRCVMINSTGRPALIQSTPAIRLDFQYPLLVRTRHQPNRLSRQKRLTACSNLPVRIPNAISSTRLLSTTLGLGPYIRHLPIIVGTVNSSNTVLLTCFPTAGLLMIDTQPTRTTLGMSLTMVHRRALVQEEQVTTIPYIGKTRLRMKTTPLLDITTRSRLRKEKYEENKVRR